MWFFFCVSSSCADKSSHGGTTSEDSEEQSPSSGVHSSSGSGVSEDHGRQYVRPAQHCESVKSDTLVIFDRGESV